MTIETQRLGDKIRTWLVDPLPHNVQPRIMRLANVEDVQHVAVMPDVHLTAEYCVGTAVATRSRFYPHAIGGDIGCGMMAVCIDTEAERLTRANSGEPWIRMLQRIVPFNRHPRRSAAQCLPTELADMELSDLQLEKQKARNGRVQLGTLGRGNHFLEFQADQEGRLWFMLHSGSRAMGQAITSHHLRRAQMEGGLPYFPAQSSAGNDYLHDLRWASEYARQNRLAMLQVTAELIRLQSSKTR